MKSFKILIIVFVFASYGFLQAQNEKLAQTGMTILSLSMDARMSAMGRAAVAVEDASMAMMYNPAGMAAQDHLLSVSMGQMNWIADFKYQYANISFSPENGQYGVFGLSFLTADYGDFYGTIRAEGNLGYIDTGTFSPLIYAFGIGYARSLTDKFSIGANARYVYQNLTGGGISVNAADDALIFDEFAEDVLSFDFGILYKTGYKSLNFGMYLRNFSQEVTFIEESFQLPLTFEIGLSMNVLDFTDLDPENHSLLVSVDASHPRDFSEQVDFGVEYEFNKTFALRGGYTSPTDIEGISMGIGFNQELSGVKFQFDYAYTSLKAFPDDAQRLTLRIAY